MKKGLLTATAALMSAAVMALAGCITSPASLSPSTVPITTDDAVTQMGPAGDSACGMSFLFFQVGQSHQVDRALQKALKASGADALIEVKVEASSYFGIVYCTEVYGTAVKLKRGGAVK